jgi:DNA-binding Lrp family transcriptional regulator
MRLKNPTITNVEIAEKLGIGRTTLQAIIRQAKAEGWLQFSDPMTRIEYEIIPKAVDNLNYWLEKRDKVATLETMKGTAFKDYQAYKGTGDNGSTTYLALKIEMPDGEDAPKVIEGKIVGKPKELKE